MTRRPATFVELYFMRYNPAMAKPNSTPDISDLDAIAAEGERSDRTTGLLVRVLIVIARELRLLRAGQRL